MQPVERHLELIAGGYAWVATASNQGVVGFVNAERFGTWLHVWEASVRYECQGYGIGRRLLDCVVRAARATDLAGVTLTTFSDVPWNRPFYERLGFVVLGTRDSPYWLQRILEDEAGNGLPGRCAMALILQGRR